MMKTMVSLKETESEMSWLFALQRFFLAMQRLCYVVSGNMKSTDGPTQNPHKYLLVRFVSTVMQCSTKLPRIGLDMTR